MDPESSLKTAIGGVIPRFLVDSWHQLGSEEVITLAEGFAVWLARISFRHALVRRSVMFFVDSDNEGARYSFIKGVGISPSLALLQIVKLFHTCSEDDDSLPWVERVPSEPKIADLPIRGQTQLVLSSTLARSLGCGNNCKPLLGFQTDAISPAAWHSTNGSSARRCDPAWRLHRGLIRVMLAIQPTP